MDWLAAPGLVADVVTLVVMAFTARTVYLLRKERLAERDRPSGGTRVRLRERGGPRVYELPLAMRRTDVTRAEVQGRINCIPRFDRTKQYGIAYINSFPFVERIEQLQALDYRGPRLLEVWCSPAELKQFDVTFDTTSDPGPDAVQEAV